MLKYIHIAAITRHGGSLLARLLDGHTDIASMPTEFNFSTSKNVYPHLEKIVGYPTTIPNFKDYNGDIFDFFDLKKENEIQKKLETEKLDQIGVRQNYIEKAYYDNIKTNFDKSFFFNNLTRESTNVKKLRDLYDIYFKNYFDAWDNGKYKNNFKYLVTHSSSGLFLDNFIEYYNNFKDSLILTPIRDPVTYIASEKVRLAKIFFGTRRFYKPSVPNFLIKSFNYYDLHALIRSWNVAITRVRILNEKLSSQKYLCYQYEDLINKTQTIMAGISEEAGFNYEPILQRPTLANNHWSGNSHYGKVSNLKISNYFPKVLNKKELELIKNETYNLYDKIKENSEKFINLQKIDNKYFYDYDFQKKYSEDKKIWSLYCAFAFSGTRKIKIKKTGFFGLVSYFFSIFSIIVNIPRQIKLRLSTGTGKQNYT